MLEIQNTYYIQIMCLSSVNPVTQGICLTFQFILEATVTDLTQGYIITLNAYGALHTGKNRLVTHKHSIGILIYRNCSIRRLMVLL